MDRADKLTIDGFFHLLVHFVPRLIEPPLANAYSPEEYKSIIATQKATLDFEGQLVDIIPTDKEKQLAFSLACLKVSLVAFKRHAVNLVDEYIQGFSSKDLEEFLADDDDK